MGRITNSAESHCEERSEHTSTTSDDQIRESGRKLDHRGEPAEDNYSSKQLDPETAHDGTTKSW